MVTLLPSGYAYLFFLTSHSMTTHSAHPNETHYVTRSNWLRAAVLGANDGILSTASILAGMAAGGASHGTVILGGLAGLVAGAASMATGEYVSVQSQADLEKADLKREARELKHNHAHELKELAQIYVGRGLDPTLAQEVAVQLTAHDALGAHARDELGISEINAANPLQASMASAASFSIGGALPLIVALISPLLWLAYAVTAAALGGLMLLGILGARTGGVKILRPTLRVLLWGAVSMGLTAAVGHLFGTPV